MNLLQLNPPIPVETPRGKGMASVLIDYGPEYDLLWVCFIDESRECWTYGNRDVRIQPNITFRRPPSPAVGSLGILREATRKAGDSDLQSSHEALLSRKDAAVDQNTV